MRKNAANPLRVGRTFVPGAFSALQLSGRWSGVIAYNLCGVRRSNFATPRQRCPSPTEDFVIQIRLRTALLAVATLAFVVRPPISAQEPGTVPETRAPSQPAQPPPGNTVSGHPADAYWTAHDKQLLTDFGGLAKYKEADVKLPAPAP